MKFILDENAKPIDTYVKVQQESHKLIEDFMLLANRRVAEKIGKTKGKKPKTFVYRIHDEPNPEKLNTFIQLVSRLGYSMNISNRQKLVTSYNNLFKAVEGKGEKNLIESVAIRTMPKPNTVPKTLDTTDLRFRFIPISPPPLSGAIPICLCIGC